MAENVNLMYANPGAGGAIQEYARQNISNPVVRPQLPSEGSFVRAATKDYGPFIGAMNAVSGLVNGTEGLAKTWQGIILDRETREYTTDINSKLRQLFVDMSTRDEYKGKGADNFLKDYEDGAKNIYANWQEQNPDANSYISGRIFGEYSKMYASRVATAQIQRMQEYDQQTRIKAAEDVVDTTTLDAINPAAYKGMADGVRAQFPNNPAMQVSMVDKGFAQMVSSIANNNPSAFYHMASNKRNQALILSAVGEHNGHVLGQALRTVEAKMRADEANARARASFALAMDDRRNREIARAVLVNNIDSISQGQGPMDPNQPIEIQTQHFGKQLVKPRDVLTPEAYTSMVKAEAYQNLAPGLTWQDSQTMTNRIMQGDLPWADQNEDLSTQMKEAANQALINRQITMEQRKQIFSMAGAMEESQKQFFDNGQFIVDQKKLINSQLGYNPQSLITMPGQDSEATRNRQRAAWFTNIYMRQFSQAVAAAKGNPSQLAAIKASFDLSQTESPMAQMLRKVNHGDYDTQAVVQGNNPWELSAIGSPKKPATSVAPKSSTPKTISGPKQTTVAPAATKKERPKIVLDMSIPK
jgi:hypothetical protein